jgi:hypothetical protein
VKRVDVDQHGGGAGHLDRGDGGHGGVGDGDDGAAGTDSQSAQGQGDGVGAVAATDHGRDIKPGGERGLEGLKLAAEDVPAGGQDTRDSGVDLWFQRLVAGAGIGGEDHR